MKVKIAVVQMHIKQYHPEENLKKAVQFLKKASGKANIIVFPEDFITGPISDKLELADTKHKYVKLFQKFAKKYNIDIVAGSIIEKDKLGIYNTAYYIDSKGKIISKYRKINLWLPQENVFSRGDKISLFNTKYGKMGLIICWDLIFPELFRNMTKKGVKIVICPSYWTYEDAQYGLKYDKNSDMKLVNAVGICRAFENQIIVVFCNAGGNVGHKKHKEKLLGQSQISVPFIGAIKKLAHNREAMFIQEIDTSILHDAEKTYKIRKDLKD